MARAHGGVKKEGGADCRQGSQNSSGPPKPSGQREDGNDQRRQTEARSQSKGGTLI
jgi:hypothetical protein